MNKNSFSLHFLFAQQIARMARHGNPPGAPGTHGPPSDDALSNYDQVPIYSFYTCTLKLSLRGILTNIVTIYLKYSTVLQLSCKLQHPCSCCACLYVAYFGNFTSNQGKLNQNIRQNRNIDVVIINS